MNSTHDVGHPTDRLAVVFAMVAVLGARWPHIVAVPSRTAGFGAGLLLVIAIAAVPDALRGALPDPRLVVVLAAVLLTVSVLSQRANTGLVWNRPTPVAGWATIVRDPGRD